MSPVEITMAGGLFGVLAIGGGIIWNLSWKISKLAQQAETAIISIAHLSLRNETLAQTISAHEAFVARTYVSTEAIRDIKTDLVAAVNRLGDRLDSLFLQVAPHQKAGS